MLIIIHFLRMNPLQYTFYFWNMLYGISHGFDITHDVFNNTVLLLDGLVFQRYFVYFTHDVARTSIL